MPPAEQIEIRRLTAEDAHAYYGLRLEALEHEPLAFNESSEEHRAITIETIEQKLGSGEDVDSFVLGAFTEDLFIGMVGFGRLSGDKKRHRAVIWGVYVKPEWRRKGIARVLLSETLERAKAVPGIEQVVLSVGTDQTAARKLYESLAFEVYGRDARTLKVADRYVDEDLMILWLAG
ncbi:MAG TPA: N-acetyltransferase [Terriglobales bacterium]|nr:N-acetyltransferase [Terriglobales bacterium]